MRKVTKVHMSPSGHGHEHIEEVTYEENGASRTASVGQMVTYIEGGDSAKVSDGINTVSVMVVDVKPKHIRTKADGKWTDNLLALPRY